MSFEAQVIAAYGRHLQVRDASGTCHDARPFGRKMHCVCGDWVRCESDAAHGEVHVLDILPRTSMLSRSTLRGDGEPVVANLSLVVVVFAPLPSPDLFIVDRYLCAASSAGLRALVVLNKVDLIEGMPATELTASFRDAGYPVLHCSTTRGEDLGALREALHEETAVFVGQSGVGKSSLIGALVPQAQLVTGELDRDAEGRHTTTSSRLYDLPGGGQLIDSPGVRDFAPAIDMLEARSLGFPEVDRLGVACRFQDCQHLREPACAVREAAETGSFDARRYESYRRLRRLYAQLREARGPGRNTGGRNQRE
ncbi:MAG: ribosome small subunit-dependent GTPase A [Sinobacteraceae bacterium]|nr:ribosome small subunit-dependent GTPase A [Nevskiaceae bacterium]